MKKKILALLLCLALVFNSGVVMAATQTTTVKEDKTAKIFIDGVALKTTNVPIIKNGTLMLSTELFTALGINAKSQVWDKSKTKLTLTKGKTKVVLQLDSANANLNGKKISVSVKPFKYKGKAYFVADFIAECFDKQFTVDTETNTYFLKDKTEFAKNKKLIDNILKAMNGVSKLKISEDVKLDLNGTGVKLNLVVPATTLSDRKSGIASGNMTFTQTVNGNIEKNTIQLVLANNTQYTQANGGEWEQQAFTADEFAAQFDFNGIFAGDDVIYSALNTTNGTKKDEIILKGNIIMGSSIPSFLNSQELADNSISSKSIEITLNKTTNIVSKIVLKLSGITTIDKLKYNFTVNYVITYSDINGSFEVIVPNGLK